MPEQASPDQRSHTVSTQGRALVSRTQVQARLLRHVKTVLQCSVMNYDIKNHNCNRIAMNIATESSCDGHGISIELRKAGRATAPSNANQCARRHAHV